MRRPTRPASPKRFPFVSLRAFAGCPEPSPSVIT